MRCPRKFFVSACAVALALLGARASSVHEAEAATVVELDLAGLVERAELVLEARVESAVAEVDARGRIETRVTLATARTFLGESKARHTIRVPGGVLPDGRGLVIPGLPRLAVDDEAVLFLTKESRAGLRLPVGLAQGRFALERAADGTKRLVRDHAELEYVDAQGRARPARPERSGREVLDYARTASEIETLVAARRDREQRGEGRR